MSRSCGAHTWTLHRACYISSSSWLLAGSPSRAWLVSTGRCTGASFLRRTVSVHRLHCSVAMHASQRRHMHAQQQQQYPVITRGHRSAAVELRRSCEAAPSEYERHPLHTPPHARSRSRRRRHRTGASHRRIGISCESDRATPNERGITALLGRPLGRKRASNDACSPRAGARGWQSRVWMARSDHVHSDHVHERGAPRPTGRWRCTRAVGCPTRQAPS